MGQKHQADNKNMNAFEYLACANTGHSTDKTSLALVLTLPSEAVGLLLPLFKPGNNSLKRLQMTRQRCAVSQRRSEDSTLFMQRCPFSATPEVQPDVIQKATRSVQATSYTVHVYTTVTRTKVRDDFFTPFITLCHQERDSSKNNFPTRI